MLLIEGVKYEEWVPEGPRAEGEFEQVVKEHTQEIFGEESIYIDIKHKLKSKAGTGTIPDGYVITFGDKPQLHIIEIELSSHSYEHIISQITKIITCINDSSTWNGIAKTIRDEIIKDEFTAIKAKKAIGSGEVYEFLYDRVSNLAALIIVIDKNREDVREGIRNTFHREIQMVEFQTFKRVEAEAVHAHLFVPLYTVSPLLPPPPIHTPAKSLEIKPHSGEIVKARKVTFEELVSAGLLQDGQVLYFYNTQPFTDERAQVIVSSDKLKYERDGHTYSKSELASILLEKHGFKRGDYPVQGPKFWKTEDGKLLDSLNEQIRSLRGDRG